MRATIEVTSKPGATVNPSPRPVASSFIALPRPVLFALAMLARPVASIIRIFLTTIRSAIDGSSTAAAITTAFRRVLAAIDGSSSISGFLGVVRQALFVADGFAGVVIATIAQRPIGPTTITGSSIVSDFVTQVFREIAPTTIAADSSATVLTGMIDTWVASSGPTWVTTTGENWTTQSSIS